MIGLQFNHTMLRVKDPKASLKFYQDILGMKLIREVRNDDAKFSLYFLVFDHDNSLGGIESKSEAEKWNAVIGREGERASALKVYVAGSDFTYMTLQVFSSSPGTTARRTILTSRDMPAGIRSLERGLVRSISVSSSGATAGGDLTLVDAFARTHRCDRR